MRFPNKVTTLNESVIGKGVVVLNIVRKQNMTVAELYSKTKRSFTSFLDYLDTLDYLFAINKISLASGGELICYAE